MEDKLKKMEDDLKKIEDDLKKNVRRPQFFGKSKMISIFRQWKTTSFLENGRHLIYEKWRMTSIVLKNDLKKWQ